MTPRSRRVSAAAAAAAVVVLYAAQVWAAYDSSRHGVHIVHALVMIGAGLLQSAALFALARALATDGRRRIGWVIAAAAALMLALSAICPNTDDDASAYIAYAKLPSFGAAYAPPPHVAFAGGGFEAISRTWPELPPLVYGPLWLALDRALVGHAPTYAIALAVLRIVNAVLLAALLLGLRRLGCDRPVLALVALNPALYFYFVVQAHNDLLPVVLVVAGMVVARRSPLLGALIAGSAGLVKIAFLAIAPLAYAGRTRAPASWGLAALSVAVMAAISWLLAGAPYLHAMSAVGRMQIATRTDALHLAAATLHLAVAAVAALAVILALTRGVFLRAATYAFSAISAIVYPWYLGWCIPYALRAPAFTTSFLISLPALAHLIDPHFSVWPERSFALLVPCYLAVLAFVARDALGARGRVLSAPE